MPRRIDLCLLLLCSALLLNTTFAVPPPSPVRPVTDSIHGIQFTDPYRWLEGDASGKITPEVADWTTQQNAHTRQILDNLPGRAKLETRLRQLLELPSISAPRMRKNRYFHSKREGNQNQAILYVREGFDGESRILLDPNSLDKTGLTTLAWYRPNHDGTLLAFGTFRAGDENATCRIMEVESGKWLPDEIPNKVSDVHWLPDSSGFVYRRLAEPKNPYSGQVCFHRMSADVKTDAILFEQYKTGPLATTWGPHGTLSEDGHWLILSYSTSTRSNDLWAVDFDHWLKSGEFSLREIVKGADAAFASGPVINDTLYMQTTLDAPNGRVVAVNLINPDPSNWKPIIPQRRPDIVIDSVAAARDILVVQSHHKASSRIELFDLDGKNGRELKLPGIGSAGLSTEFDRTEAFLTYTSYNDPTTIYRLDLAVGRLDKWARTEVPVDYPNMEVHQVVYTSADKTPITMFLVHRKGLALSGDSPTILTGYGGFGIGTRPSFSAGMYPFLEAGGVYALPNLRGGDEYGEAWHKAGMLANKQNVFDDFISAAEWLINNKYTNPKRLGISGGSNGGLLVGAALTQRPDLFSAVICDVPLLDMLRYQNFLMARYWVPEYGSAEDAEQFRYLAKYSPYQQVKPGVKYPAVLLGAGQNDTRVHPLHARKMAALLQASTTSDPTEKPILLWVETNAGHGGGKPLSLRLRDEVDRRLFMMWQLGVTWEK